MNEEEIKQYEFLIRFKEFLVGEYIHGDKTPISESLWNKFESEMDNLKYNVGCRMLDEYMDQQDE